MQFSVVFRVPDRGSGLCSRNHLPLSMVQGFYPCTFDVGSSLFAPRYLVACFRFLTEAQASAPETTSPFSMVQGFYPCTFVCRLPAFLPPASSVACFGLLTEGQASAPETISYP